nr:hypothetical protein [Tanacetum cinerariifolium]
AFLVTADVLEIYMQESWATATVHQHSIRFKMDTKKHIVDLESFREMLHISPRVSGQSFAELPFEEEILEFFRNVDFAFLIWEDLVYQVEHKNKKKSNEMYYPRFIKVIIHHFMTKKPSIPRRNSVNWHYVRDDILFSTIKVAAPKPKASARKKKGGSASSTTPLNPIATPTPPITVVAAPRLSTAAKGKQPARARSPTKPSDVERTDAEQLKIVLKQSRQETHISQQHGSSTDEGTGSRPGVLDVPYDDSEEELSWNSSDDEDVKTQVKAQVTRILPRIEESVNAQLEAEVLTRASYSSRTSYAVAADLSEMELKKILIDKIEGNKSIQRSDEQ